MMVKKRSAKPISLVQLMKDLKQTKRRLEDVPVAMLREAQKHGFPDMRSIILPPLLIRQSLQQPLLRDLLVTRVGYCSRASGHYIPRPEGSFDHIMHYCVGGKGWVRIAGRQWEVMADTAVFLPRQVPHLYGADPIDPWSVYWIHFTGKQAGDFFETLGVGAQNPLLRLHGTEEVLSTLRNIESHMAGVHTRPNLLAAATTLASLLGLIHLQHFAVDRQERTEEESIRQTIDFMNANLARQISLRELAHLAHMSISRYEAVFSKRTACSPINYFHRMKIQKTCRLLTETDLPLKVICTEIGYDDPYYFSRRFKKMMGVAPSYFRKPSRSVN